MILEQVAKSCLGLLLPFEPLEGLTLVKQGLVVQANSLIIFEDILKAA